MTIISKGYCSDSGIEDTEWQLFCQHIDLLLQYKQTILNCSDYFFCHLSFAATSFPYLQGDGPLNLGHLILGWEQGILIEQCFTCERKMLITSFAGSPLTGRNGWTGICINCHKIINGRHSAAFRGWMNFVLSLRRAFPATVQEKQEYDGFEFSWGEPALKPVRKARIIAKPVCKKPATLTMVIEELATGNIRRGLPINVLLLKKNLLQLKFSSNGMNSVPDNPKP